MEIWDEFWATTGGFNWGCPFFDPKIIQTKFHGETDISGNTSVLGNAETSEHRWVMPVGEGVGKSQWEIPWEIHDLGDLWEDVNYFWVVLEQIQGYINGHAGQEPKYWSFSYHICWAYLFGLDFREYPNNSNGQKYDTNVAPSNGSWNSHWGDISKLPAFNHHPNGQLDITAKLWKRDLSKKCSKAFKKHQNDQKYIHLFVLGVVWWNY